MSPRGVANLFGVLSVTLSLLFWVALLKPWMAIAGLVEWDVKTHMTLWLMALVLLLVPAIKQSKKWLFAALLPILNFGVILLVIGFSEYHR